MGQQLLFYLGVVLGLPVLPFLYLQGKRVRATVPKLPPAEGPEGSTGDGAKSMRLLTLGESTVAGVGVPNHRIGFTGSLARELCERSGKSVRWLAVGQSGFTARQVAEGLVPRIPTDPLDLIVIGLGGNDTFKVRTPLRWKRDMVTLIREIRKRQPECPIVIANLPPIGEFIAFPRLMQWFLGGLVRLHGDAIRDLPSRFANVHYVTRRIRLRDWIEGSDEPIELGALFCDGVHPSPLTYALWSKQIVDHAWPRIRGSHS